MDLDWTGSLQLDPFHTLARHRRAVGTGCPHCDEPVEQSYAFATTEIRRAHSEQYNMQYVTEVNPDSAHLSLSFHM